MQRGQIRHQAHTFYIPEYKINMNIYLNFKSGDWSTSQAFITVQKSNNPFASYERK